MIGARLITGLVLGLVIVGAVLLLPKPGAVLVLGLLWVVGGWEWAGLARRGPAERIVYAAVCAAAMGGILAMLASRAPVVALAAIVVALAWWAVALGIVLRFPRKLALGFAAAAGFFVLLPSWTLLAWLHMVEPDGRALTLAVLVIVWAADVGAYTIGRWLGRVKLAPAVSPGKTWEGAAGGLVAAGGAAWAVAVLLGLPSAALVAVGVATAAVSVLGDLTVSAFKRNVGVKDTGSLLPGHGGVMDRIDSLTAAVPVFVLGLRAAGIGA